MDRWSGEVGGRLGWSPFLSRWGLPVPVVLGPNGSVLSVLGGARRLPVSVVFLSPNKSAFHTFFKV